jgi:hypothetical protein
VEGLVAILGFGIGASVGTTIARGLGEVLRPVAVGAVRIGMQAGDAARTAATTLGTNVATAASGAKENLSDITAEAKRERNAAGDSRDTPARRIEVAHE